MVDDEEAGALVGQVLKQDFEFICDSIDSLRRKGELKKFECEDLSMDFEVKAAMKVLLRYYLTHDDYNEFMELQRVYGNV